MENAFLPICKSNQIGFVWNVDLVKELQLMSQVSNDR